MRYNAQIKTTSVNIIKMVFVHTIIYFFIRHTPKMAYKILPLKSDVICVLIENNPTEIQEEEISTCGVFYREKKTK